MTFFYFVQCKNYTKPSSMGRECQIEEPKSDSEPLKNSPIYRLGFHANEYVSVFVQCVGVKSNSANLSNCFLSHTHTQASKQTTKCQWAQNLLKHRDHALVCASRFYTAFSFFLLQTMSKCSSEGKNHIQGALPIPKWSFLVFNRIIQSLFRLQQCTNLLVIFIQVKKIKPIKNLCEINAEDGIA